MKFLQIGDDIYINAERINGIYVNDAGVLQVIIGGSYETWAVDSSYANDVLAFVRGKGAEK